MHIHLTRNGDVLALSELNGAQGWRRISVAQLESALAPLKDQPDIAIAYSRDDPNQDPPKNVELIYKTILSFGIPMKLLPEPLVSLEKRL